MKKVLAGIAVFVLVFSLAATPVFAAGHGRGHGGGTGTGTGTGVCSSCENCLYDDACPYNGDCPNDCPNNGTRPQDGTGAHHGGSRSSGRTLGHSRGTHARDGSCLA